MMYRDAGFGKYLINISEFVMERNLLEREIAALNSMANSLANLRSAASTDAEIIMYPSKFAGKITEQSYLRKEDLKTIQIIDRKKLYYPTNQWIDVLGENEDWFLVEGEAAYVEKGKEKIYSVNNTSVKLQGWVKKPWIIYKTPPKLIEEPKPGAPQTDGYTCYVEIDLRIGDKGYRCYSKNPVTQKVETKVCTASAVPPKMTAIYVPQKFQPIAETDLIIYLHGYLDGIPDFIKPGGGKVYIPPIKYYLNYVKPPDKRYFNFREIINRSGKNVIFVAPTLGGKSQSGNLVKNFDNYVDQVIWAINEHIFKARKIKGKLNLRNLILTAHSGGGSPMLKIAQQKTSKYVPLIKSYWGFDSWYQGSEPWNLIANDIAKNKKTVTIYAYKYNSNGVPKEDKKIVFVTRAADDQGLKNITKKDEDLHFPLLPYFFEERMSNL
jgi:hypothetical protein